MARAWEQAGAAAEANAVLRGSQLARELGGVVMERHLAPLPPPELRRHDAAGARAASRSPTRPSTPSCRPAACPRPWSRAPCAGSPARRGVIARRAAAGPAGRHARRRRSRSRCAPPPGAAERDGR